MAIQREDKRIAGLAVSGHIRDLYRQAVLAIIIEDQRYRPTAISRYGNLACRDTIQIDGNRSAAFTGTCDTQRFTIGQVRQRIDAKIVNHGINNNGSRCTGCGIACRIRRHHFNIIRTVGAFRHRPAHCPCRIGGYRGNFFAIDININRRIRIGDCRQGWRSHFGDGVQRVRTVGITTQDYVSDAILRIAGNIDIFGDGIASSIGGSHHKGLHPLLQRNFRTPCTIALHGNGSQNLALRIGDRNG